MNAHEAYKFLYEYKFIHHPPLRSAKVWTCFHCQRAVEHYEPNETEDTELHNAIYKRTDHCGIKVIERTCPHCFQVTRFPLEACHANYLKSEALQATKEKNTMQGIYEKYIVKRTDGTDEPGGKHHGCELFVLDLTHDPVARKAARKYADLTPNKELSEDIMAKINEIEKDVNDYYDSLEFIPDVVYVGTIADGSLATAFHKDYGKGIIGFISQEAHAGADMNDDEKGVNPIAFTRDQILAISDTFYLITPHTDIFIPFTTQYVDPTKVEER